MTMASVRAVPDWVEKPKRKTKRSRFQDRRDSDTGSIEMQ